MFKTDKKLHAAFSLFFATIATVVAHDNGFNFLYSYLIGVATALFIGILVELYDEFLSEYFAKMFPRFFNPSQWSWLDLVADYIGGNAGGGLGLLIILAYG